MADLDRRRFLQLTGGTLAASALSTSIARAAAIPAHREHGSLRDIDHVVVLMQENRSFDHYFGTLRGVRGFGDPHPATLPSGRSVWHQAGTDGREILPFRPEHDDLGLAFLQDLDHGWDGGHDAFRDGHYDGWVPAKTATTMAHLRRADMPFHYALADAFTVCDAYHCSLVGPTDPNRYYLWSGWVGNDGKGGGPVITNAELGYSWTTYPERLERAGVSWKVYQDAGSGLDATGSWGWDNDPYIGNYGDNSLLYFDNYRAAKPGDPLYEKARRGTNAKGGEGFFDQLRADVRNKRLPQVSWIAAPEAFTEHPNWPVNYGAWYIAQVLDALTSDPEVWSRTALLITYDENDGFFDHVVPPYAPTDRLPGRSTVPTVHENYTGSEGQAGPYGLGQRVPMIVVSPWSTGGWVCSETLDHTSVIRLLEARFGVHEPNISPWRRAVCGDLTAAFDFAARPARAPQLPGVEGYYPPDRDRHPDFVPTPPADPTLPRQEPGTRPSRPLGYRLEATGRLTAAGLELSLRNPGRLGAAVQVRHADGSTPGTYTVGAKDSLAVTLPARGHYDLTLHGPNGFFRRFAGDTRRGGVELRAATSNGHRGPHLEVELVNTGGSATLMVLVDRHAGGHRRTVRVRAHARETVRIDLAARHGWYDLQATLPGDPSFAWEVAGRVETGRASTSDPLIG